MKCFSLVLEHNKWLLGEDEQRKIIKLNEFPQKRQFLLTCLVELGSSNCSGQDQTLLGVSIRTKESKRQLKLGNLLFLVLVGHKKMICLALFLQLPGNLFLRLSPSCVRGEWGPANINVVPFLFSYDNDRIIFEPNNS